MLRLVKNWTSLRLDQVVGQSKISKGLLKIIKNGCHDSAICDASWLQITNKGSLQPNWNFKCIQVFWLTKVKFFTPWYLHYLSMIDKIRTLRSWFIYYTVHWKQHFTIVHLNLINHFNLYFQVIEGVCLTYAFWKNQLTASIIGILIIAVHFIIPLVILTYCNGRVIWILTRRLESNLENDGGTPALNNTQTSRDKFQLARTNTLKTFLLVGICFVICWVNNQIYYLITAWDLKLIGMELIISSLF